MEKARQEIILHSCASITSFEYKKLIETNEEGVDGVNEEYEDLGPKHVKPKIIIKPKPSKHAVQSLLLTYPSMAQNNHARGKGKKGRKRPLFLGKVFGLNFNHRKIDVTFFTRRYKVSNFNPPTLNGFPLCTSRKPTSWAPV